MFNVTPIPMFSDNYCWLINNQGHLLLVDPGHGPMVLDYLQQERIKPDAILITHNHWDHVGGNLDLVRQYALPIYGPEQCPIPGLSNPARPGHTIHNLGTPIEVLATPGHKAEHISFYIPSQKALFCGDTLFAAGCGRVFDGTAEQLFHSLQRLKSLPDDSKIYCAHEYTLNNLKFALAVEPNNHETISYRQHCQNLRDQGLATVPTKLKTELAVNPFLRTQVPAVITAAEAWTQRSLKSELEVFSALRDWKNRFR